MDSLGGMTVFAKVVEARSFTAAARELGLSKSAVSKQITALENRLGARLLNRTTRKLSLTEAGEVYFERAQRIMQEVGEAEHAVTHLADAVRGRLRVNAPMSFGILHIAPALADFHAAFPELEVAMDLNDRFVDLVEEGYDVAVRIGALAGTSLIARRLADARHVLCASPSFIARYGRPEAPADLARLPHLRYAIPAVREHVRFADGSEVGVDGPLISNNGDVLVQAAASGVGIAALPSFIAQPYLRDGRLLCLLAEHPL